MCSPQRTFCILWSLGPSGIRQKRAAPPLTPLSPLAPFRFGGSGGPSQQNLNLKWRSILPTLNADFAGETARNLFQSSNTPNTVLNGALRTHNSHCLFSVNPSSPFLLAFRHDSETPESGFQNNTQKCRVFCASLFSSR